MAEKKGFDLAGLMKSVSKMSTREQIEYLPFDLLDADPNNFYSLDDIEELADSIATVGLVHPLRVRQCGERYTITSGHRRRAAIQLLIDSGEDWSQGVPCVVDRGESEPELAELKLIFANRQRQKTSAELRDQLVLQIVFCVIVLGSCLGGYILAVWIRTKLVMSGVGNNDEGVFSIIAITLFVVSVFLALLVISFMTMVAMRQRKLDKKPKEATIGTRGRFNFVFIL